MIQIVQSMIEKIQRSILTYRLRRALSSERSNFEKWHSDLKNTLALTEPQKSFQLQDLALRHAEYDAEDLASLVITLLETGDVGFEGRLYCNHILQRTGTKAVIAFLLLHEFQEQEEHLRDRYQITTANHLIATDNIDYFFGLIGSSDFALRRLDQHVDLIENAYANCNWIPRNNEDLFFRALTLVTHPGILLRLFAKTTNSREIINLTSQYLRLHRGKEDISELRYVVQTLGTLSSAHDEIMDLLEKLKYLRALEKHIEHATHKQLRMRAGKTKSYKHPWPAAVESSSLQDQIKSLSFARYEDRCLQSFEQEKIEELTIDESVRIFTNEVRQELGLKKIGEGWASETLLFKLVCNLLAPFDVEVRHHHRPNWLKPQEVDIFFEIEGQQFGVEYQGKQHYEPISFFGGQEGFRRTVARDQKKRKLCEENGLHLIYFKYTTPVDETNVRKSLEVPLQLLKTRAK